MGQILHGCAATTAALRRTIQNSQESLKLLAMRYRINAKTVAKWRKRTTVRDSPMGPRGLHSTVLSAEQEATIVAFRRQTLLLLDDCLYALQPSIPHLTRSSLHRCLKRYGISRLPNIKGDKPVRKKFAHYPIGYFHLDIAASFNRTGQDLSVCRHPLALLNLLTLNCIPTKLVTGHVSFSRQLISIMPYHIHTILTDNGIWVYQSLKRQTSIQTSVRPHLRSARN